MDDIQHHCLDWNECKSMVRNVCTNYCSDRCRQMIAELSKGGGE